MTATPNRSGLINLYPHTALIQSFDTARFHEDRFEDEERIGLARTEALLNLLYGRELLVPAGQIADSPAIFSVFLDIMSAFEKRNRRLPEWTRWRPFRIALEPGYRDYADYVAKYRDIGAPMALLPLHEQRKQAERAKALAHLKELFLEGKYEAIEKGVDRAGYAEYARLVAAYYTADKSIRPLRDGISEQPTDYGQTLVNRAKRVAEGQKGADLANAIIDTVPYIAAAEANSGYRGAWYAAHERFGDSWELARIWLDQAIYLTTAKKYGVEHPVYVTQDTERGKIDPQVILGYDRIETPDGKFDRPQIPQQVARVPKLDWDVVWDVMQDEAFHRRVDKLTAAVNKAEYDREIDTALWEHTEFLNQALTEIAFSLKDGCIVLNAKKKPGRLKSMFAGAVTAGAIPLLLNSFIPGSAEAVTFVTTSASAIAAGLVDHVIKTESQWFYRRRKKQIERSNKEILREAMEVVNFWTKPVLNAGDIAHARSASQSGRRT